MNDLIEFKIDFLDTSDLAIKARHLYRMAHAKIPCEKQEEMIKEYAHSELDKLASEDAASYFSAFRGWGNAEPDRS